MIDGRNVSDKMLELEDKLRKNLIADTLTEKISATSLILRNNLSFGKSLCSFSQKIDFFAKLNLISHRIALEIDR